MKVQPRVPVLETKRLILREHRAEDFTASAAMWAHPSVAQYTIGSPSSETRTWGRLMTYRGLWEFLGYGYWAVIEKSTGKFVGDMGFAEFRREIDPPIVGTPESGWAFAPEFHGKGFGTEALTAALNWGDEHFERTVCLINPDNIPSVKLAQKLGYREYHRSTHLGQTAMMLERFRTN